MPIPTPALAASLLGSVLALAGCAPEVSPIPGSGAPDPVDASPASDAVPGTNADW